MNFYFPGGKGASFHNLINLMPPHQIYIETHLGGGAVLRHKRPARHNVGVEIDPEIIQMWEEQNEFEFEMIHGDALHFLKSYPFAGEELVYCDPPYLRETRKRTKRIYKYEYTRKQHEELLEALKSLKCNVMISGYESMLYKEFLIGWHTHTYQASCQHGVATEWIWMNYSPPEQLHDYRYLGGNFREREQIRNKLKRWTAKIKNMPVLERNALLAVMDVIKNEQL